MSGGAITLTEDLVNELGFLLNQTAYEIFNCEIAQATALFNTLLSQVTYLSSSSMMGNLEKNL